MKCQLCYCGGRRGANHSQEWCLYCSTAASSLSPACPGLGCRCLWATCGFFGHGPAAHHLRSSGWSSLGVGRSYQGSSVHWCPHRCARRFSIHLHSIHYPGEQVARRLITARFSWSQRAKSSTLMARACLLCQQGKVHRHGQLQSASVPVPHRCFAHIHVNLVGLLTTLRGDTCGPVHCDRQDITATRGNSTLSITELTVPEPYSPAGSPVLECQPSSHLTEAYNHICIMGSPLQPVQQWRTTHSQMGWWSGSTGS